MQAEPTAAPTIDPVELAATVLGDGPPLIVLHGLLGSGRNWGSQGKALAADNRVHLVDMRNHGSSPWSNEMSYAAMAADIIRLMDARGIERASFVGHSMGGKAAMLTALLHPERVARLVVVDIAPVTYDSATFSRYLEAMRALDLAALSRRAEVETALQPAAPEPAIRAFLAQNIENGPHGLRWKANLAVLAAELGAITDWPEMIGDAQFAEPVLFLSGGASQYVLPEHREAVTRRFPAARSKVIAGAGHWLHAEAPRQTVEAIGAFVGTAA